MPKPILAAWHWERNQWLRDHGIDPSCTDWQEQLIKLGHDTARECLDTFWNRWHDALDAGHGACVLRAPELAKTVARSLRHADGKRYLLLDFIIMPNHVHFLAAFPDEKAMLDQCESWKHFTATQINRYIHSKGRFWQSDAFDHLVRSEEQFQYLRRYIANNPTKAHIPRASAIHYSRPAP
jgi:REP element-mobilizing transposase RayT